VFLSFCQFRFGVGSPLSIQARSGLLNGRTCAASTPGSHRWKASDWVSVACLEGLRFMFACLQSLSPSASLPFLHCKVARWPCSLVFASLSHFIRAKSLCRHPWLGRSKYAGAGNRRHCHGELLMLSGIFCFALRCGSSSRTAPASCLLAGRTCRQTILQDGLACRSLVEAIAIPTRSTPVQGL